MSTVPAAHYFRSALLLVDAEVNAAVDRRALREAGLKVRIMTSGLAAAQFLVGAGLPEGGEAGERPGVILCHGKLGDMSGPQFVQLVRLHPLLLGVPVLLVSNDDDEASRLDTLASGATGLLVRPYSQQSLLKALHALAGAEELALRRGARDLSTAAFDAALRRFSGVAHEKPDGTSAFNAGLQALQQRRWDVAIAAFQRAMREITLKGESELGLAAAWHGKGDMARYRHYLREAGLTFARARLWHRARVTYMRLLRVEPGADSPFLAVAERHIRAEDFTQAAEALAAGYDLGELKGLPDKLVQACLGTAEPGRSVDSVLAALASSPMPSIAADLGGGMREALAEADALAERRARAAAARSAAAARAARREQEVIAPLDDDLPECDAEAALPAPAAGKARKGVALRHDAPILPPLSADVQEMESTFFSAFPVLNEVVTVMRVTHDLLRHTRNKP